VSENSQLDYLAPLQTERLLLRGFVPEDAAVTANLSSTC
jgi:hypothetical protein